MDLINVQKHMVYHGKCLKANEQNGASDKERPPIRSPRWPRNICRISSEGPFSQTKTIWKSIADIVEDCDLECNGLVLGCLR